MTSKRVPLALSVLSLLVIPVLLLSMRVEAEEPTTDACRTRFVYEMARRRDEYRAHVFGARATRDGELATLTRGYEVDQEVTGIFEAKGRLTSELIEPLTQAYRTYQCRLSEVCPLLALSTEYRGDDPVGVDLLGCEARELPRYEECYFGSAPGDAPETFSIFTQSDRSTLMSECETMVRDTLDAEASILKLAVSYDASYRSMLQFAGMMEWMTDEVPTTVVRPIRDMVNMLGKLSMIPCFTGQCDAPPSGSSSR